MLSQRVTSKQLVDSRAQIVYNEGVLSHTPFQQETPVLADGGFSNPSKGRDPMHELYLSYDSTIQIANPIPLVLMNLGVICVGGAS